ncbi:portal protein [Polaribacter phage Danklef_4]|nr:portal protein [Polaribacter phage Danklef_2]QQV90662.1 portal protein [Polaribacter phage Danklef_3]QQV90739.1 portal protein [Polaribacter phage Danklef_4]QQV90816.1 portal protein [Polaribacter phage Danklef_5]
MGIFENFKLPSVTLTIKSQNRHRNGAGTSNIPPITNSSTFITKGIPVWKNFAELIYLLDCYYSNPVVQAIINVKAEAFANIKFKVKDLKTGEIVPLEEYEGDNGELSKLLSSPNPLQSTKEWLRQNKVNYEVFGDSYMYGSIPVGFESSFDYTDINVINNLPSYNVATTLTGNWLDATTKEEIIKNFVLTGFNGKKRELHPNTVLHLNNTNIKFDQNFNKGKSDLLALKMPITNIYKAYESRNVLISKRGPLGAWTPDTSPDAATGASVPLVDTEIEDVQKAFKKYGLLDDQYQQIVSPVPLKWQKTGFAVKDLMLFEEIEADAIAIAVAKGVPELLVKYYIKGGTFNNLDASEKRLYDSTIIPESEDFMQAFNQFLKLKESGIQLIGSFDHLNILQGNKKEEAQTNREKEKTALSAFKIGAIKFNDYLIAIGMPLDDTIGDLRIWDLSAEQLNAIGINVNENKNEG